MIYLKNLQMLLKKYDYAWGQWVNNEKSNFYTAMKASPRFVKSIVQNLGFSRGSVPFVYLGLQLVHGASRDFATSFSGLALVIGSCKLTKNLTDNNVDDLIVVKYFNINTHAKNRGLAWLNACRWLHQVWLSFEGISTEYSESFHNSIVNYFRL